MNAILVLQHYKQHRIQEVEQWPDDTPAFAPLDVSQWIAMSLM